MIWNCLFNSNIPLRKCDPITSALGDVGLGVGSIIGNVLTNKSNQDFAREMWEKNNEYNLPKNQRRRLEEAGYNPYLLTTDSSASGQSVQPSTPASQGLPSFGHPFSTAQELLQSGLQVQSNIELQRLEGMQRIYDTLIKAYSEGGQELYNDALDELAPTMKRFEWNGSFLQERLRNSISKQELENANLQLDNTFKGLENRWYGVIKNDEHRLNQDLHKQYVQTLDKIKSEIRNLNAKTDLAMAEKEKVLAEKVGVLIENGIKGLDYENQKELQDVIQETAYEQLWKLEDARNYQPMEKTHEFMGKAGQYLPYGAGQFEAARQFERNNKRNDFKKSKRFKYAK